MQEIQEEVVFGGGRDVVDAMRGGAQVLGDKKKRVSMPTLVSSHEMSAALAAELIPKIHHHLAAANIAFLGINKPQKGLGIKVQKANPVLKYLTPVRACVGDGYGDALDHVWHGDTEREEIDFLVVVSIETFNNMERPARTALVDHALTRMAAEEDEESGEMKFSLRDFDVQDYAEVAERNGAWHHGLQEMRQCLRDEAAE